MNIERLKILRDGVIPAIDLSKLQMGGYVSPCGTFMCLAGHAAASPLLEGIYLDHGTGATYPRIQVDGVPFYNLTYRKLEIYFDINHDDSDIIFEVTSCSYKVLMSLYPTLRSAWPEMPSTDAESLQLRTLYLDYLIRKGELQEKVDKGFGQCNRGEFSNRTVMEIFEDALQQHERNVKNGNAGPFY